jgi:hypothetical protein
LVAVITHVWLLSLESQVDHTLWGACLTEKGILDAAEKVRKSYSGTWVRDRPTTILSMPEGPPVWFNSEKKIHLKALRFPIREDIIDLLADPTRKP